MSAVENKIRDYILSNADLAAEFKDECDARGISLQEGVRMATLELREYATTHQDEILSGFDDEGIAMLQQISDRTGVLLYDLVPQVLFESQERLDDISDTFTKSVRKDLDDLRGWIEEA